MRITYNIEPVSQARPRIVSKPFPRMYDTKEVKTYKEDLKRLSQDYMVKLGIDPLEGSLEIRVIFYRSIQKSISKKEHLRRQFWRSLPEVKPDVDNYIKSFLDGLNGVIWRDDAQITDIQAKKRYSEKPRIELEVFKIEG